MEATTVIRKPLISEKSTFLAEHGNRYAFHVDRRATKVDIRRAVEALYGVRVVAVATQNKIGKLRRTKFGHVRASPTKRAIVKVHRDDRIELF